MEHRRTWCDWEYMMRSLTCRWCHESIEGVDIGKPCPDGRGLRHWPDNRHYPLANPCPCRRPPSAHRVSHWPKGDPCVREIKDGDGEPVAICGLPASSHITRKPISSPTKVRQLRQRDGWACRLCGRRFGEPPAWPHPMSVTIDHIVPVWRGGSDDLSNLQLAHNECNLKKQNDNPSPRQRPSVCEDSERIKSVLADDVRNILRFSLPKITLGR